MITDKQSTVFKLDDRGAQLKGTAFGGAAERKASLDAANATATAASFWLAE